MNRLVVLGAARGLHLVRGPGHRARSARPRDDRRAARSRSIDLDRANPPQPSELLAQLVPTEVCALIADPGADRRVRYELTLCVYGEGARCRRDLRVPLGAGLLPDPETSVPAAAACATVEPNGNLLGVLGETLEGDTLRGLGGLDYLVQLTVGGEDADPTGDLFAAKTLRVAPRIPAERQPNVTPSLARIDAKLAGEDPVVPLPLGRCIDQPTPYEVRAGATVRLTPIEATDARETYAVPTIDGKVQTFTESLTYQWIASAGRFSSGSTGGPRDVSGNPPPLFSDWRAPRAAELDGVTDVQLWIVQRDERLGVRPYTSCVRVVP